jgi:hypothetical protein
VSHRWCQLSSNVRQHQAVRVRPAIQSAAQSATSQAAARRSTVAQSCRGPAAELHRRNSLISVRAGLKPASPNAPGRPNGQRLEATESRAPAFPGAQRRPYQRELASHRPPSTADDPFKVSAPAATPSSAARAPLRRRQRCQKLRPMQRLTLRQPRQRGLQNLTRPVVARRVLPNPSLELIRYGRQRKPGLRHSVHHLSPGLRCLPPLSAQLER